MHAFQGCTVRYVSSSKERPASFWLDARMLGTRQHWGKRTAATETHESLGETKKSLLDGTEPESRGRYSGLDVGPNCASSHRRSKGEGEGQLGRPVLSSRHSKSPNNYARQRKPEQKQENVKSARKLLYNMDSDPSVSRL